MSAPRLKHFRHGSRRQSRLITHVVLSSIVAVVIVILPVVVSVISVITAVVPGLLLDVAVVVLYARR